MAKEIWLKFLLLLLLLRDLYLVAKPSMSRSVKYVSLLKLFSISARRVPHPPEVPNRHRFHTRVQTFNFFKGKSYVFLTILEIRLLSRTHVQSISYQCIKKYPHRDPVLQDFKRVSRGTKSTTSAEGFCQPFNFSKFFRDTI